MRSKKLNKNINKKILFNLEWNPYMNYYDFVKYKKKLKKIKEKREKKLMEIQYDEYKKQLEKEKKKEKEKSKKKRTIKTQPYLSHPTTPPRKPRGSPRLPPTPPRKTPRGSPKLPSTPPTLLPILSSNSLTYSPHSIKGTPVRIQGSPKLPPAPRKMSIKRQSVVINKSVYNQPKLETINESFKPLSASVFNRTDNF